MVNQEMFEPRTDKKVHARGHPLLPYKERIVANVPIGLTRKELDFLESEVKRGIALSRSDLVRVALKQYCARRIISDADVDVPSIMAH